MTLGTQRCGRCKLQVAMDEFCPSQRGKTGMPCRPCARASRRGESGTAHQPRQCKECGDAYTPKQLKAKASFCSQKCGTAHSARLRYDPSKQRRKHLAEAFGMTPEQWSDMFAAQADRCAICRTDSPGQKGWHTDHNHDTGNVRGILCSRCNLALGLYDDDPQRLRAAAEYLEREPVLCLTSSRRTTNAPRVSDSATVTLSSLPRSG